MRVFGVQAIRLGLQWMDAWCLATGFAFGVYPQLGLVLFVLAGCFFVFKNPKPQDRLIEGWLVVWCLLRVVWSWRVFGQPWSGALEVLAMWLLFRGVNQKWDVRFFARGSAVGLWVSVLAALAQAWSLVPSFPGFIDEPKVTQVQRTVDTWIFRPLRSDNSWVYFSSSTQGSGSIRYEFEARTTKQFRLGLFLNEFDFIKPKQRWLGFCQLSKVWTKCEVNIDLAKRLVVTLGLGGNNTWKTGDPMLEIRSPRLTVVEPPSFAERLFNSNRTAGWSFNENGLGVWVVVVALLVVMTAKDWRWIAVVTPPGIIGIMLSGSRAAFFAGLLGVFLLLVVSAWQYWPKWRVWSVGFAVVVLGTGATFLLRGGVDFPTALRAIDVNADGFIASRLDVYKVALGVAMESPIFGVGNASLRIGQGLGEIHPYLFGTVHAHNLFLQVMGEMGMVGLGMMVFLWTYLLVQAIRLNKKGAMCLLFVLLWLSFIDYLFLYSPIQVAFWMTASKLLSLNPHELPPKSV